MRLAVCLACLFLLFFGHIGVILSLCGVFLLAVFEFLEAPPKA